MGNRRSYKAECIHTLGTPESEHLKVAALNLFRPTAFPLLQELVSCYCATVSKEGESFLLQREKRWDNGIYLPFEIWSLVIET
jgi:hypothetical protein